MARLVELPDEILHQIFMYFIDTNTYQNIRDIMAAHLKRYEQPGHTYAAGDTYGDHGRRVTFYKSKPDYQNVGRHELSNLCLTSRRLDTVARPLLYRTFVKPPTRSYIWRWVNENATLRLFLRALMLNPSLRAYVRELYLLDWPEHLHISMTVNYTLSEVERQEYKTLLSQALTQLGITGDNNLDVAFRHAIAAETWDRTTYKYGPPPRPASLPKVPELLVGGRRALVLYEYMKVVDNDLECRVDDYVRSINMVHRDWWVGQDSSGDVGYFPSNFVKLLDLPCSSDLGGQRAIVEYDYYGPEDNELELRRGEFVTHIEMLSEDWWTGQNPRGETGHFPSNCVTLVADEGLVTGGDAHKTPGQPEEQRDAIPQLPAPELVLESRYTDPNVNEDAEIAVLLMLCPNVKRLAMAWTPLPWFSYRARDGFLHHEERLPYPKQSFVQLALRRILTGQVPLNHFTELEHCALMCPDSSVEYNNLGYIRTDGLIELRMFPAVTRFDVDYFKFGSELFHADEPQPPDTFPVLEDYPFVPDGLSKITTLNLTSLVVPRNDLTKLLTSCASLTSLSMSFMHSQEESGRVLCSTSWTEVVDCFRRQHASSLRHLKLEMDRSEAGAVEPWFLDPIDDLQDFVRLETLELHQSAFLRLHNDGSRQRRPIVQVLPVSLQSLKITCFDSGLYPQMDAFVEGLPASHPELKKVEVMLGDFCGHDSDRAFPPHNLVRSAEDHLDRIYIEFVKRGIEFVESA